MVLALSLPDSFKYKNIIVALVFGVVLLSIFIQGLTMSPLLKILRLASPTTALKDYETLKTQIRLFESSIDRLETLYKKHLINKATYEAIKNEYLQKIDELSKQLEEIKPDPQALKTEEFLKLQRRLLTEQKSSLLDMYQNGIISYEVYRNLEKEIDNRLFELENTGA
jgi:CPA1 family monovalent cation:H+ antiporter